MAPRLTAAALISQGGECVCPAQADHTGEGAAGIAVARGVIGRQCIPTTVLDGDAGARRCCLETHLDLRPVAGVETFLTPFDYEAPGGFPREHTSDFEGLPMAVDFQQAAAIEFQSPVAAWAEQPGYLGLPPCSDLAGEDGKRRGGIHGNYGANRDTIGIHCRFPFLPLSAYCLKFAS
jgi:hypothetical protein